MNAFNNRFRLIFLSLPLLSLLIVSGFANGPTAPNDNNDIVLTGFFAPNRADDRSVECTPRIHYVNLAAGRTYFIRLNSSEPNTWLALEDLHGNRVAMDNELWDEINGCILFRPLVTDRYRVVAGARMPIEVGFYTINIRDLPAMFNVEAVMNPAEESATHTTELRFEKNRRYVIEVASDAFPAVARLLNAEGAVVAFDDEGCLNDRTRMIFTAPRSEVFRIEVSASAPFIGGVFRLTVSEF